LIGSFTFDCVLIYYTDEIGVPFALTIDFQTVQDRTVTIRERDTTTQIRLPVCKYFSSTPHTLPYSCVTNCFFEISC
jgi:glycyl-tRNA synthetase